jgi:hypothetical protein
MVQLFHPKWEMAVRVFPIIVVIAILKAVTHYYNWEFFGLNTLFAALISANIFLIGFNLSAVLADFKKARSCRPNWPQALKRSRTSAFMFIKAKKQKQAKSGFFIALIFPSRSLTGFIAKSGQKMLWRKLPALLIFFFPSSNIASRLPSAV